MLTNKIFLFFASLLTAYCIKAQVNLVKNPSFEQLINCPNNFYEADSAKYWNWINPLCSAISCKGSLLTTCCTNPPACGTPYNWFGYQKPRTGNSYICIVSLDAAPPSINNNMRQYLKGQFSSTLQTGKNYCLTFYYNASNTIQYVTNRFGAYIDNGTVASYNCCKNMPVTPQAQNNPAVFMTDTMNWVKIQGSFTAIGNENTITLGNFVDSATIQFQLFNSAGIHAPYYLIDDVSLLPIDLIANAGKDTSITLGDSAYIGRPREVGLDDDCIWYVLGNATPFDTVAGLWVKPNTLGTHSYVVEQNICGTVTYDTVVVTVNPVGVNELGIRNEGLRIWPNPGNGIMNLELGIKNGIQNTEYDLQITNVLGEEIKRLKLKVVSKITEINVSDLNEGIYFISIKTKENVYTQKIIVQR